MVRKIFIGLQREELAALSELAARDLRDIRDEAVVLIRDSLAARGALVPSPSVARESQPPEPVERSQP